MDIFEQKSSLGYVLGLLDASLHLYQMVHPLIAPSVPRSVCPASKDFIVSQPFRQCALAQVEEVENDFM